MTTVTIEIPDFLAEAWAAYVAQQGASNPDKAGAGALALWLLQNGHGSPGVSRAYLDAILPTDNVAKLRRPRRSSGADAA